jgi:hypothetical protein
MLLDAMIEIDRRQLQVKMECNVDEELGIFLLPIKIIEADGSAAKAAMARGEAPPIIASGELKISIVNPIIITSVVLYATGFGFCMIQHMAVPIYELFVRSYEEARLDANPTMAARVRNLYERVKGNIKNVVEPTERAIKPCAGFAASEVAMKLLGI